MKHLWLKYGGSNRKMSRDITILKSRFPEFTDVGSTGTGHWSNRHGTINDTPANRILVKSLKGITISREMNNL